MEWKVQEEAVVLECDRVRKRVERQRIHRIS